VASSSASNIAAASSLPGGSSAAARRASSAASCVRSVKMSTRTSPSAMTVRAAASVVAA
jgi:hypothetical protein